MPCNNAFKNSYYPSSLIIASASTLYYDPCPLLTPTRREPLRPAQSLRLLPQRTPPLHRLRSPQTLPRQKSARSGLQHWRLPQTALPLGPAVAGSRNGLRGLGFKQGG